MRPGLDETHLDGLADPARPTGMESQFLEVPCCLAFVLLRLPVLGLWRQCSHKFGL